MLVIKLLKASSARQLPELTPSLHPYQRNEFINKLIELFRPFLLLAERTNHRCKGGNLICMYSRSSPETALLESGEYLFTGNHLENSLLPDMFPK